MRKIHPDLIGLVRGAEIAEAMGQVTVESLTIFGDGVTGTFAIPYHHGYILQPVILRGLRGGDARSTRSLAVSLSIAKKLTEVN